MAKSIMTDRQLIRIARNALRDERDALETVMHNIGAEFLKAVRRIRRCKGNVVVTGMGKAFLIGQKISATLASTGTPSLTLHPADALHGDLGRVRQGDVVLILTNAGETEEILRLLEPLKSIGAVLVAITGNPDSTVAKASKIVLELGPITEACPLGLAPTSSTTAMLALGDALAVTVLKLRGFSRGDFALYHPAGSLGKQLILVDKLMRSIDRAVTVRPGWTVARMLKVVNQSTYRSGAALVTDPRGKLLGIFTDGDLRRYLAEGGDDILNKKASEVMVKNPKCLVSGQPAAAAAKVMKEFQIDEVPVVDAGGKLIGLIDIQDLLSKGFA